MSNFKNILAKVPKAIFEYAGSRSSVWRHKTGKVEKSPLYFGIGISFNIDGNRENQKQVYKEVVEKVENSLSKEDLDLLVNWIEDNFYKISKNVKIKEVNSKGKLFMHLLFILPYLKYNFEEKKVENIEGFLARTLFNCTRSWYTNFCKKNNPYKLGENH